jgi:DnaJ-class molecular chaperone
MPDKKEKEQSCWGCAGLGEVIDINTGKKIQCPSCKGTGKL